MFVYGLRAHKLTSRVVWQVIEVCEKEQLSYTEEGVSAVVFTAQGDLRAALNNLQVRFQTFHLIHFFFARGIASRCDGPRNSRVLSLVVNSVLISRAPFEHE